jgi:hypothetical protein
MANRTMAWANEGQLSVTVHDERDPTRDEWDRYVADIRKLGTLAGRKVLVLSHGGGPNTAQRRVLIDAMKGQESKTAILTNSQLMRGVGIAVGWFNRQLRVFALNERDAAFAHLELNEGEKRRITATLARLEKELGSPEP